MKTTILILALLTAINCLQIPFQTTIQSLFHTTSNENDENPIHYSQIPENKLPINLRQYIDDVVIRVKYNDNIDLYKYLISNSDYKVWGKNKNLKTIDIQLNELSLKKLTNLFEFNYEIIINDLPQKILETYPENHKNNKITREELVAPFEFKSTEEIINEGKLNIFSEIFFKEYRPSETIEAWLYLLEETFPNLVKIETIGKTFEGRDYNVVHVSDHTDDNHADKKTIVITGGVHAREWISVSSTCYQLFSILDFYNNSPEESRDILNKLDFLFIPVANPDGYEYSWETDRLWRKNRQLTILPNCFGIDIDHSYDFHWTKSSDWPCGEEYSGENPFESIESKIWNDYLNKTNNNHEIFGYIDLHSYSQEILFPFAFSCNENPRDEENLLELAYGIAKSVRSKNGKFYNVLPACQDKDADLLPDLGSGTALDFMYHNKAYWAYQLKLRDSGSHGFLLPSKYIEPVGQEVFEGIKYFCKFILEEY